MSVARALAVMRPIRPGRMTRSQGIHTMKSRPQSFAEELANSLSHGAGLVASIAALPVLIAVAAQRGGAPEITGASIFGASMVLLYLASTLYHAIPAPRAKRVFQFLDHTAIYLLIAGTYTPFTLGVLRGAWGWTLFGIIWGLAVLGITMKTIRWIHNPILTAAPYVAMGWVAVIAIKPLIATLPAWGLFWLFAGGIAYTAGVVFYAIDERVRFSHFVWHLFVISGTACHFVAVLCYAA